MNIRHPMGLVHSFSIKNIFYDKIDSKLFYFHVMNRIRTQLLPIFYLQDERYTFVHFFSGYFLLNFSVVTMPLAKTENIPPRTKTHNDTANIIPHVYQMSKFSILHTTSTKYLKFENINLKIFTASSSLKKDRNT